MVAIGAQSYDNTDDIYPGQWSHAHVTDDPLGAATQFYLGAIEDAVFRTSREDSEVLGTTHPRHLELILPTRVGMQFTGNLMEPHRRNLHFLVSDAITNTSNYIYPGAVCAFSDTFVQFVARREKCDGFVMEVVFWKALASGVIEIGTSDGAVGVPIEINALSDVNGDFGGSDAEPLGYILADDPL